MVPSLRCTSSYLEYGNYSPFQAHQRPVNGDGSFLSSPGYKAEDLYQLLKPESNQDTLV